MDVREEIGEILDSITSDKIKLTIEKVYDFEKGLHALSKTKTRRAKGKTVIKF